MIPLEKRIEFIEKYLSQKFEDFDDYITDNYLDKSMAGTQPHLHSMKPIEEPRYRHKLVTNPDTGKMEYIKVEVNDEH